jgi:hypothetical protein
MGIGCLFDRKLTAMVTFLADQAINIKQITYLLTLRRTQKNQ